MIINFIQIFCIFLFTFAASLFGTLLGQIEQVFATLNKKSRELEEHMEGYQKFFWDYRYNSSSSIKERDIVKIDQIDSKLVYWVLTEYQILSRTRFEAGYNSSIHTMRLKPGCSLLNLIFLCS